MRVATALGKAWRQFNHCTAHRPHPPADRICAALHHRAINPQIRPSWHARCPIPRPARKNTSPTPINSISSAQSDWV